MPVTWRLFLLRTNYYISLLCSCGSKKNTPLKELTEFSETEACSSCKFLISLLDYVDVQDRQTCSEFFAQPQVSILQWLDTILDDVFLNFYILDNTCIFWFTHSFFAHPRKSAMIPTLVENTTMCDIGVFLTASKVMTLYQFVCRREKGGITLFRSITVFCGTDSTSKNIPHVQFECGEYFAEYCQSYRTLLWIRIMS